MVIIKSEQEIKTMRESGKVTGHILRELYDFIKPGISTMDINDFVEDIITKNKMIPTFRGYNGFPAATCVSVNDEVIHGMPSTTRLIEDGDIVSVDVGCTYKGYVSDGARTYAAGNISAEARRLITVAEECFFEGLKFCKKGFRVSDISNAIQVHVEKAGFSVVRDFVGHGIGRALHEEPKIPNYGVPGRGMRIAPGMVFAIEPMINQGAFDVEVKLDNWTVVTIDGKLSAHYENTVVITDGEPELLTL